MGDGQLEDAGKLGEWTQWELEGQRHAGDPRGERWPHHGPWMKVPVLSQSGAWSTEACVQGTHLDRAGMGV